jgi:putative methyltransferase (TIGR04325 family)
MLRRLVEISQAVARNLEREPRQLYASWDAAKRAADRYDATVLTQFRLLRAQSHCPYAANSRSTLLPMVSELLGRDDLEITDFGGSCGETGQDFLQAHPRTRYTVVEIPALVDQMGAKDSPIIFTKTMPQQCDIFFSSGTLQYLDQPLSVVKDGFAAAAGAVILMRNSFCDRELFRVQKTRLFKNGAGPIPPGFMDTSISYPHRTIRESDVFQIAKDAGFRCVARLEAALIIIVGMSMAAPFALCASIKFINDDNTEPSFPPPAEPDPVQRSSPSRLRRPRRRWRSAFRSCPSCEQLWTLGPVGLWPSSVGIAANPSPRKALGMPLRSLPGGGYPEVSAWRSRWVYVFA